MINFNTLNYYFKKRILHYGVLFSFVAFILLIYSSTFPQKSRYEGNLIVSRLSFTFGGGKIFLDKSRGRRISKGRFDKVFLRKANPLEKIIIRGAQDFTLPPGEYASEINSFFNFKSKEPIAIDVQDADNQIIIEPSGENNAQLAVSELKINPKVDVNNLIYDSLNNRLYMLLEGFQNSSVGFLMLDIGVQELKIKINGKYSLPTSKINGTELDFKLKPRNSKLNIPLQKSVWLELDLKKHNENSPKIEFGERFRVKNVRLYTRIGDIQDASSISSIIEGQIHMAQTENKLNLQSGQFLLSNAPDINNTAKSIPDESICIKNAQPNIYLIRKIEANSKGISFRIIGESKKLQSGFDPCFPVDWIQVSWLSKLFDRELHPALLAFFTGSATGLLVWIVSHIKEFLPNSNNSR